MDVLIEIGFDRNALDDDQVNLMQYDKEGQGLSFYAQSSGNQETIDLCNNVALLNQLYQAYLVSQIYLLYQIPS